MEIEEFRAHAHELVDWMADYMTGVEALPVRAQVKPGEITAKLPLGPPTAPEPMDAIMADFKQDILPGMTHWQHPRFFAYFPANSSPPSVLAEMLTATLGAQGMLWRLQRDSMRNSNGARAGDRVAGERGRIGCGAGDCCLYVGPDPFCDGERGQNRWAGPPKRAADQNGP